MYVAGGQAIEAIVLGYIVKILPTHYARQEQMKFVEAYVVGALIGPVISGVISYFSSYRLVFIISAIFATLLFVYSIIFIAGKHTKLLNCQLSLGSLYIQYSQVEKEIIKEIAMMKSMTSPVTRFSLNVIVLPLMVNASLGAWITPLTDTISCSAVAGAKLALLCCIV